MSESDAQAAAQKQRVLLALTKLRAEIDELRRARCEPIAIVGMSARFPGSPDADAYWDLLRQGCDGISEVPPDRWSLAELYDPDPDVPGKMYTRFGGFLQDIDRFDAAFFGISPREATAMDPQHRMLLEAAWHALEDAAIAPDSLRDQPVGVYLGLCSADYGSRALSGDTRGLDAWFGQGISFSTAAGRVSYVLGTHGPSLSLDTACSSSLVGIDLACRSLRDGQCSAALVGAASVILVPQGMINFCQARVLAPDGRCKSFDAAGDGYVRSEGVAMVVLKRLSDATPAGDRIIGVIRGVSIQHHGRSSSLTAPNGPAQERVMRDALRQADVDPAAVDYVEAHGTGTLLGDSIEFAAMARTFGPGRTSAHPLRIGCVKSNIGHTEGPAGLAGLIKVLHAFEHQALPPTIHLRTPSPLLDQPDPEIQIPRTLESWPRGARPRIAGVSAFSLSGTNAHVVVAEPPADDVPAATDEPRDQVLVLSARSEASLAALKASFRTWLADRPDGDWRSICFTAAVGRAHLPHRVAVVAASPGEAVTALDADTGHSGLLESGHVPRVAMIFAGQGAFCGYDIQKLYTEHEAFRRTIDACEPLADRDTTFSLRETILADGPDTRTGFARDASLFAVEAALYRLWEHWGVRPYAVLGHGLGEYVAAHVTGMLSLEDAFTLLRARSALLEPYEGRTASILVFATPIDVRRVLGVQPDVSISAINAPTMVVVSGARASVDQACASLTAAGIHTSVLPESSAAHTGLIDDGLDRFETAIRGIASGQARLRQVSSLSGTALSISQRCDAAYWRRQVREPVRFEAGVQALAADWHCDTFVEVGPSGAFVSLARESLPAARDVAWIPSLTARRQGARDLQHALGRLYVRGVPIDWRSVHAGPGRRRLRVPTYPFDRQRYWLAGISAPREASSAPSGTDVAVPPPAAPPARPKEDGALTRVMGMTPIDQRLALLRQLLKTRLAALLGFESTTLLEDRRPLNEVGLNSLMALELKSELDRGIGTAIPAAALFEHVTVDALARFLGRTYFDVADAEDLDQPPRRLRDEVVLPDDIYVEKEVDGPEEARTVLLTGATGYLGAYLLRSLLSHTAATVSCLVRGNSPAAARERLLARQREIDGWDETLASRIAVVVGDLAEPRFGLDAATYASMAEAVDVVYHSAATVNFVLPYLALKRTTVGGTTEVLRFCATGRPKPLHYVGTIAVLLSGGFQAADRLPEQEDLGDGSGLPMGYAQAKWVAEQLVLAARARGLSTTVYRPGFIGGHSRTGDCKLDDLIPRLAQGCIELGCAPDFGGNVIDFSPVDYVSDAVVHLSRRSEAAGGLFHLTHPAPTPWTRFVDRLREHGYSLESLPYQDWLLRLNTLSETSALRGLVPFFEGMPSTLLRLPPAECARTQRALAGITPSCPDHTVLLDRYLDYFWRIGWIPRPPARV